MSSDERADIRGRRLGFVFQAYNLLPRTSALENVELPMVYAGVPEEERRRIALAKLEMVGIAQLANHHPNQMSGGQQQRVAIARSLVNDPGLILADEPTGALDTKSSQDVMRLFTRLNEEQGITIMLVTHEPDVAAYARRIVTFRDGLITERRAQRKARGMTLKATLRLALAALIRNKARSMLTMLGIVIGVAAVIVTVAIGVGARTSVAAEHQQPGIESDRRATRQRHADRRAHRFRRRLDADARRRAGDRQTLRTSRRSRRRFRYVRKSSPVRTTGRRSITGVAPTYTYIRSWPIATGRFFNENEVASAAKVAVLGQTVVGAALSQRRFAGRTDGHYQRRAVYGDRNARVPRPERPRTGPGRHRTDSLYFGDGAADRPDDRKHADGLRGERRPDRSRHHERHAAARAAPPHRSAADRRFSGTQFASNRADRVADRNGDGAAACRRRRRLADRRRNRNHEHHARFGHGANARDRAAHGGRRASGTRFLRQFLAESVVLSTIGGLIGVVVGGIGNASRSHC